MLNLSPMRGFRSSISSVPFKAALNAWVGSSPQVCSCVCVPLCGCAFRWRSRRRNPGCYLAETLEELLLRKIFLQEGRLDSSTWTIFISIFFVISCIKYTNTGKYRRHNISSWVCVSKGNTYSSSMKAVLKWARGLSSENIQRYKYYWEWSASKFLWVSMCFLLKRIKHCITSWTSWTFPQSSWIYWSIIM